MLTLALLAVLAADDGCTLSEEALRSQLEPSKLPKGAKVTGSGRVDRLFRETLSLANGLEVKMQIGGCAHLGIEVSFSGKPLNGLAPAAALALVKKQLAALPLREHAHLPAALFIAALGKLEPLPAKFPAPLQCEAEFVTCELDVNPSSVRLGYDFAL